MDRRRAVLLVAGITAGVIVTGAVIGAVLDARPSSDPYESSYTISVEQVEDRTTIENESIIEYKELSAPQQEQFDKALEGRFESDSLALDPTSNVRYNGTVYKITVATA